MSWIAPGGLYAWNSKMKPTTPNENLFRTPQKGGAMEGLGGEHQWARLDTFSQDFRVAVISVSDTETKHQAWRRHVSERPEDKHADIRIFNFARR